MQSYSSCALGTMSHCPKTSLIFKPFLKETTLQHPWMSSAPLLGIPLLLSSHAVAVSDGFSGVCCPMLLAHRQEQGRGERDVPKELWLGQWWAWALLSAEQIPKPCNGCCHPRPSPEGMQGSGSATVLLALCSALLMSGATRAGAELHFSAVTPAFFHAG